MKQFVQTAQQQKSGHASGNDQGNKRDGVPDRLEPRRTVFQFNVSGGLNDFASAAAFFPVVVAAAKPKPNFRHGNDDHSIVQAANLALPFLREFSSRTFSTSFFKTGFVMCNQPA